MGFLRTASPEECRRVIENFCDASMRSQYGDKGLSIEKTFPNVHYPHHARIIRFEVYGDPAVVTLKTGIVGVGLGFFSCSARSIFRINYQPEGVYWAFTIDCHPREHVHSQIRVSKGGSVEVDFDHHTCQGSGVL